MGNEVWDTTLGSPMLKLTKLALSYENILAEWNMNSWNYRWEDRILIKGSKYRIIAYDSIRDIIFLQEGWDD